MNKGQLDLTGGARPSLFENERDDLFVCCASFEDRSLTAVRCLHKSYFASRGLVYVNAEFAKMHNTTRSHLYAMIAGLAVRSERIEVSEGSLFDVRLQLEALKTGLSLLQDSDIAYRTVTIDATTFNRESLLLLCGLLSSGETRPAIRVLYTSPMRHGDWLSRGVRKVRNVIGFAGTRDPQLPTALVMLSGFEGERALKIIEEHEPAKLYVGVGDPPTSDEFLSRNVSEQHLVLSRQDVERFYFPANDIDGAYKSISSIITRCEGVFNVVIAPMSTKLSTLAVLRVAVERPEVQVTYCVPGEYNTVDYSVGERRLFVDQLF